MKKYILREGKIVKRKRWERRDRLEEDGEGDKKNKYSLR